jgi:hypothetical protein
MIYFGGQHIQENIRLPRKVNEWVYRPFNINRTHCYGLRGRKMIEQTYKHLNNVFDWDVPHHVDHYLGELHKRVETGIYVPKEWLVFQSEGKSDVCCKDVELRLFAGAEELMSPPIDRPCCAVMGTYFGGINTLAGAMKELGIFIGLDLGKSPNPKDPHFFEDIYLGGICRNSYTEPWLEEQCPPIDRINHLRRWAGIQCQNMPKESAFVCGKHPILSLMGQELLEAWNSPKFITIERDLDEAYKSMQKVPWGWHPSAAKYSFALLEKAREEFFAKYQPPLLRIQYDALKAEPQRVLSELCEFLQHTPTPQPRLHALDWIQRTEDDLCYLPEVAEQTVQSPRTPPSCEKHKKKRKKR